MKKTLLLALVGLMLALVPAAFAQEDVLTDPGFEVSEANIQAILDQVAAQSEQIDMLSADFTDDGTLVVSGIYRDPESGEAINLTVTLVPTVSESDLNWQATETVVSGDNLTDAQEAAINSAITVSLNEAFNQDFGQEGDVIIYESVLITAEGMVVSVSGENLEDVQAQIQEWAEENDIDLTLYDSVEERVANREQRRDARQQELEQAIEEQQQEIQDNAQQRQEERQQEIQDNAQQRQEEREERREERQNQRGG